MVRVTRHRRSYVIGAVVGGVVGAVCGVTLGALLANEGGGAEGAVLGLTAAGIGAGAGIDALLNIPHTVYKAGRTRTSVKLYGGPKRPTRGLAVTF